MKILYLIVHFVHWLWIYALFFRKYRYLYNNSYCVVRTLLLQIYHNGFDHVFCTFLCLILPFLKRFHNYLHIINFLILTNLMTFRTNFLSLKFNVDHKTTQFLILYIIPVSRLPFSMLHDTHHISQWVTLS